MGHQLPSQKYDKKFQILCIEANDSDHYNILKHFIPCIKFIKQCLIKGENILVVCESGMSLSCTIILAYLIKEKGMLLSSAMKFIVQTR